MDVKKSHLKEKKANRDDHREAGQKEEEVAQADDEHANSQRPETPKNEKDADMEELVQKENKVHPRRVWGKRGTMTSSALYAIATTPQRVGKDPTSSDATAGNHDKKSKRKVDDEAQDLLQQMKDLTLQVRQEMEQFRSSGATSSSEQVSNQQDSLLAQIQKLTDIANRHDDEIDDLRGMSDFTHEIVIEREYKDSMLKMVIKSGPKEASYYDRVRITDWLLHRAGVTSFTKQEHGYYSTGRKFTLSPVTILTFDDEESHHMFEKYAYSTFSAKWPLYYWDVHGNYAQHWKGGWHKLVITNYISKIDLTINLALTTVLHILTSYADTGYTGTSNLSHRPTDKQIFDLNTRKVVAKVTYDKDRGVLAIIVHGNLIQTLESTWHEAWKVVHKDHPRYHTYNRFPYAVTFAEARLEDEQVERKSNE